MHVDRVARSSAHCRCLVISAVFLCMGAWFVLFDRVYGSNSNEDCDQPIAELVRANCVILVLYCFQRPVSGHVLLYDYVLDGSLRTVRVDEPIRVGVFNSLCFWSYVLACALNLWMLCEKKACGYELRRDFTNVVITTSGVFCWRNVLRGYFPMSASVETAMLLVLALFYPYSVLIGILILIVEWMRRLVWCARHGRMRQPRVDLQRVVDDFDKVPFDPEIFREGAPGGHSSTCSICLEDYCESEEICRTHCAPSGHVFHTECLRGWAKRAETCPLCRQDLARPVGTRGDASRGDTVAPLAIATGDSISGEARLESPPPAPGAGAEVFGAMPLTPRDEVLGATPPPPQGEPRPDRTVDDSGAGSAAAALDTRVPLTPREVAVSPSEDPSATSESLTETPDAPHGRGEPPLPTEDPPASAPCAAAVAPAAVFEADADTVHI